MGTLYIIPIIKNVYDSRLNKIEKEEDKWINVIVKTKHLIGFTEK